LALDGTGTEKRGKKPRPSRGGGT